MLAPRLIDTVVRRQVQSSRTLRTIVDIDEVAKALAPELPSYPFAEIKQLVFERVVRAGADARWK